jgi:hypothetical protein
MNIDVFQNFTLNLFNDAINIIENFEENINLFNINQETFRNFCEEYDKKKLCQKLTINDNKNDENLLVNFLNKIILFRNNHKNNVEINHDFNNIFTIPVNNIYQKYFDDNNNFFNMNFDDIEHLYSDFKIIIKLIQSYKQ